jgi:putative membrane protein
MRTSVKLAFLLACAVLAGFVIATTKPSVQEAKAGSPVSKTEGDERAPASRALASVNQGTSESAPTAFPPREETEEDAAQAAPPPTTAHTSVPATAPTAASSTAPQEGAPIENRPPSGTSSELRARDFQFLAAAMESGELQLYLGELAKAKAETDQVKAVGDVLASTQVEENKKLANLASLKGIPLLSTEPAGKTAVAARLDKLNGPKFDKVLMEEIIAVNQKAVATYEAALNSSDDDIKAFANEGLTLAKEKLTLASKMSGTGRRSDQLPTFRIFDRKMEGGR